MIVAVKKKALLGGGPGTGSDRRPRWKVLEAAPELTVTLKEEDTFRPLIQVEVREGTQPGSYALTVQFFDGDGTAEDSVPLKTTIIVPAPQ